MKKDNAIFDTCVACKKPFSDLQIKATDNKWYCLDCFNRIFDSWDHCKAWIDLSDKTEKWMGTK